MSSSPPTQNLFKDGAVVLLKSRASEKQLRMESGKVTGTGAEWIYGEIMLKCEGR